MGYQVHMLVPNSKLLIMNGMLCCNHYLEKIPPFLSYPNKLKNYSSGGYKLSPMMDTKDTSHTSIFIYIMLSLR